MPTKKKKTPSRISLHKNPNPKFGGTGTRGPKAASRAKAFSLGKILFVLIALLRFLKGDLVGKCYTVRHSGGGTKTFDLSKCASGQNTFTYFSFLRMRRGNTAYPKDNELRTYFRYSDKIYIKIQSFRAGKDEEVQVFKTDEGATPIMRAKISMERRGKIIFIQVTKTKAILAVRSYFNARFDQTNNHEFTFSKAKICLYFFLIGF